MDFVLLEIDKILHRRFSLVLLIATAVLLPVIVKIISYLNIVKDNVPEYMFADNVAYGTIAYTQTYIFLPVWVIVLVGQELSNGYVNRVSFARSRKFYFLLKFSFCGIVTVFFSIVGLLSLLISIETSSFQNLDIDVLFYFQFLAQIISSTFVFSILLMCLVFLVGSPLKTFVIYFVWTFVEGILFTVGEAKYGVELKWLPLHLVRTLYVKNGEPQLANYYNPFFDNPSSLIVPVGFVCIVAFVVYKYFSSRDLPILSD